MSYQIPPRVEQVVRELNDLFWDEWDHKTADFPDTEEGDINRFSVVLSSVILITSNYILGFSSCNRKTIVEQLVNNLRKMEIRFRDKEPED